ncbi:molybdopterin-dependent oxidoreductase alpha subunit [Archangium gephyra]|uniref:Formate dehydrogenase oxidoreductase protein n=1 Tax=Archangium gephyra TaxID=48 RepID=A0AAC8Q256_9BACT|nr:FdhF/YdeP family oxidoreductase [Archangium gephyra]AKI99587.1 Putative formate dehydrogenase oxidoreductase protein [Archangium gephyra]REG27879.1 molybdopterin-dependent oxidoreductase alpha subunit [Archangium gephyra]
MAEAMRQEQAAESQSDTPARPETLPSAQPPTTPEPLRVGAPAVSAGGMPAVVSAMKHAWGEMGPVRGTQTLLKVNQTHGFDCPGCAWPDPKHRPPFEFCENGAKAVAEEATTARVTPDFFRQWSLVDLAAQTDHWLGKQGRLTHPMVLREGASHYASISWDEAFTLIAGELNALGSPDEACFYTSGRTSNEAAFLYQLFVRQFGTNNLPDCSNMCHESSGTALLETIGIGKGTVTLEDFEKAQVIIVIGQNPGTNHPRMLTALEAAKRQGCRILSINPLPEPGLQRFKHPQAVRGILGSGTPLADLFLQVRINGDVALLQGLGKALLAREAMQPGSVVARDFVEGRTLGFEAYAAHLDTVSWEDVVEQSGVAREQLETAADWLAGTDRIIWCWAMGLTQHRNAVGNIQEIVNLTLLRGSIGKPGAGVCPVRGHSNVQGDRTMGIWERPRPAFLDALSRELAFEPPRHHGMDTVATIQAMHEGRVKVFFALGGNFLSATPDTERTAEALRRTRLTVHVSTKLNRAHLVTGKRALILPCLGRTESDVQAGGPQFVTVENSMGVVHASRGALPPASEHLLSEPALVSKLARAVLGSRSSVRWEWLVEDYDRVRELISRVVPGFEDFNRRVREPGGFALPNGPREGRFTTQSGKGHFTVHEMSRLKLEPGQLLMMTIRTHDQYNTTVYGLDDRYRGIRNGRRVVMLNAEDMKELGVEAGQGVDLTSHFEGVRRVARKFVVVPYDIPRRCAATYFPEANVLVPLDSFAEKSRTPTSKSVIISLSPAVDLPALAASAP